MAGIVHFSNYLRYVEYAEHAFFRSFGESIHARGVEGGVRWPRVQVDCRYSAPLYFEDEVEIELIVRELTRKTIRYEFIIRRLTAGAAEGAPPVAARGSLTVVATQRAENGELKSSPIPEAILAQIEPAPASNPE